MSASQKIRPRKTRPSAPVRQPLGQILLASGRLSKSGLAIALKQQKTTKGPLGEILVAHALSPETSVIRALAAQSGKAVANTNDALGAFESEDPMYWITQAMIPWGRHKGKWQVAASDEVAFEKQRSTIEDKIGPATMVWASRAQIQNRQQKLFAPQIAKHAETCVTAAQSCRGLNIGNLRATSLWMVMTSCALIGFLLWSLEAWRAVFFLCLIITIANLMASTLLKATALLFSLHAQTSPKTALYGLPDVLPKVSILIPLYKEKDIASQLIVRLERLDYPRSHLEILLVLESHDCQTKACLAALKLPSWIRVIEAAPGQIKTKPRALNYALPFCMGDIIGVLDAEDAPEPSQLRSVVTKFSKVDAKTVCLQGRLDYYNPRSNWLARCFTMEYASWFRVLLPALAQLGFAIPLGGTTLYFRRSALVELGGWDAHNVTEDADLGIRLARTGYCCAMLDTTTFEEANNKPLLWIKQRSRWIKGYMMTYAVHMRAPKRLLRDLGLRQFFGFQLVFLPAILMFLLAPVVWSFWLIPLGIVPAENFGVPRPILTGLIYLYCAAFTLDMLVSAVGLFKAGHRKILPWIPSQYFYFPLATFAAIKALVEVVITPYYWDKTSHGKQRNGLLSRMRTLFSTG